MAYIDDDTECLTALQAEGGMGLSNHQKRITGKPGCPGQVTDNPVLEPMCKMVFMTPYRKVQDGIRDSYRQGKICDVITFGELLLGALGCVELQNVDTFPYPTKQIKHHKCNINIPSHSSKHYNSTSKFRDPIIVVYKRLVGP